MTRPFHYSYAMRMIVFDLNQIQDYRARTIVSAGWRLKNWWQSQAGPGRQNDESALWCLMTVTLRR
jgi:hypothetical protein